MFVIKTIRVHIITQYRKPDVMMCLSSPKGVLECFNF